MRRIGLILATSLFLVPFACDDDPGVVTTDPIDDADIPPDGYFLQLGELDVVTDLTTVDTGNPVRFDVELEQLAFDEPTNAQPAYHPALDGFMLVHLDSLRNEALAAVPLTKGEGSLQLPLQAEPGEHTLLFQLYGPDAVAVEPRVVREVAVTVR